MSRCAFRQCLSVRVSFEVCLALSATPRTLHKAAASPQGLFKCETYCHKFGIEILVFKLGDRTT